MWIPLLSKKSIWSFAPQEFKDYVRSLNWNPPKRKSPPKPKKVKPPFTYRVTAKGSLVLTINRDPKWLSREEIDAIARASELPLHKVWAKVTAKKSGIRISTEIEESQRAQALKDIPWSYDEEGDASV